MKDAAQMTSANKFKKIELTSPQFGWFLNLLLKLFERIIQLPKLNKVYKKIVLSIREDHNFWQASVQVLELKIQLSEIDLSKIPKNGPVLIVANHPFGGVEALVMGDILTKARKDFLFVANKTLNLLPEIKPYLISVSVDEEKVTSAKIKNHNQIQKAVRHLQSGGCVVMFPSGEIATARPPWGEANERKWNSTVARLAKSTQSKVVPIYFHGKNSPIFQWISLLMLPPKNVFYKWIRKLTLFLRLSFMIFEILRKSKSQVEVKIGVPLSFDKYSHIKSYQALAEYFRLRTYLLAGDQLWIKSRFNLLKKQSRIKSINERQLHPVGEAIPQEVILSELNHLLQKNPESLVFSILNFRVFLAKRFQIPNIVLEIGRLREITFRAEGEGSGLSYDIDSFDDDYEHLFIFDTTSEQVVGAYRLGHVQNLLKQKGIEGVYTHQLFHYDSNFLDQIGNAMELGRSFIISKYQKSRAFSILLTGLAHVLLRRPEIETLFGPASISAEYSPLSSFIMIEFLMRHYGADNSLKEMVKPPFPFKLQSNFNEQNLNSFLDGTHDLNELNSVIESLELREKSVPTLITYYSKIGAKYVTFNVDPLFSSIDGLIVVKLTEFPFNSLKKMIGEERAHLFLNSRKNSLEQSDFL
jgi:putative hemolysin